MYTIGYVFKSRLRPHQPARNFYIAKSGSGYVYDIKDARTWKTRAGAQRAVDRLKSDADLVIFEQ